MLSANEWLLEKHISEWSLPNEDIIAWIKWNEKLRYDKIYIKSEADLEFTRILNVDESAWVAEDLKKGKISISKNLLQLDGFIGFVCHYTTIPEDERQLSFKIDFSYDKELTASIPLETKLIRPIVSIENVSENGIIITEENPFVPTLTFELRGRGHARILKLTPFLEQHFKGNEVKVTISHTTQQDNNPEPLFVQSSTVITPKIAITGKGYGMLTMGYEYQDAVGNKYKTKLVDIPIQLQQKKSLEIPVSHEIANQKSMLLLEPKII